MLALHERSRTRSIAGFRLLKKKKKKKIGAHFQYHCLSGTCRAAAGHPECEDGGRAGGSYGAAAAAVSCRLLLAGGHRHGLRPHLRHRQGHLRPDGSHHWGRWVSAQVDGVERVASAHGQTSR